MNLKRDYAEANWGKFADDNRLKFNELPTPTLGDAVKYFKENPPRKQLQANGHISWSEPESFQVKQHKSFLNWLLISVRGVRNNLFHGGKFSLIPISEASRDRTLILHAIEILSACLELDNKVKSYFEEDFEG